jgi:Tc5 transposase DNA-binding domain
MPSELDRAVYAASVDLSTRKYTSIRAAAAAHCLSHATLTRRLNDGRSCHTSHEPQQLLSTLQEDMIVQWVLNLERQGYAPSHSQLREMAVRISTHSGGPTKISGHWISRFLKRHLSLHTKIGRNMDALRIKGTQREILQA